MSTGYVILIAVITAVVAAAAGYYMRKQFAERIGSAEQAQTILQEAEKQAQALNEKK